MAGLVEGGSDFKRGAQAEVVKQWGVLLKSYQEEIDRLTNRAKSAEASFLEVYQKLYEAPDPAPTLAAALVRPPRSCLASSNLLVFGLHQWERVTSELN